MQTRREFACTFLIDQQGRYLFQQRDNIPNIVQPGKIGVFGGGREGKESFLECAARELFEETGLDLSWSRFHFVTSYEGIDTEGSLNEIKGFFFVVKDIRTDNLCISEGALVIAEVDRLHELDQKFTPLTRYALRALLQSKVPSDERPPVQFYVQKTDEKRCQQSKEEGAVITLTGMNLTGGVQAFTGFVMLIEADRVNHGYPTLVTFVVER